MLTNKSDIKQYILKSWKISDGSRITEMLLRYWCPKDKQESLLDIAEKNV